LAKSRATPDFLDSYIVNRFVEGIALLLKEAAENPDHEIWREIDRAIKEFRENLRASPALREQVGANLREALATLAQSDVAATLWSRFKRDVSADLSSERSHIRARVAAAFELAWRGACRRSKRPAKK
jgi:uncharacterized membrane-anchored protein YjiN (DUF445 family)